MDPPAKSAQDYLNAAEAAARLDQAYAALEAITIPPEPEPEPVPILDPGPPQPVDPEVVVQWQGEWTWERAYTRGQLVSFRGSSYLALEDNELREPDEAPGIWALVAKRGRQGERGATGQEGDRGPRGYTGSPGAAGPQGLQGVKGDTGDSGGGGSTFVVPAIVLGAAAAAGVANSVIRSDSTIVAFDATAPTTSAVGDAAATGSQAVAARRDHAHGREAFGSPGNSAVGDTAGDGVATTLPRSDHRHGREAFGSPAASAVGDAGADGAATTVARSNHVHARESFAAPAASAVADAGTTGTATTLVHSDHKHAREGFGLPAASAVGDAQATGTATTVPHSDHVHARESFGAASGLLLKSTAANGSGTSPLRADASIKAFDTTAPTTSAFGDAAATGSVDFAARRDHVHGREAENPIRVASTAIADPLTLPAGRDIIVPITGTSPSVQSLTAKAAGSRATLEFASAGATVKNTGNLKLISDYRSSTLGTLTLECDGTNWIETCRLPPGFDVPTVILGTSGSEGTAITPMRTDATIAAFDATAPTTQALGDAAAVGTAAFAARRDHKHGMPTEVRCHAYHSTTQSINDITATALNFDSERYDNDTMHDTVTNNSRVKATHAGVYDIVGSIAYAANATGYRQARLRLNGTTYLAIQLQPSAGAGVETVVVVSTQYTLAATDYIELVAFHSAGTAINSNNDANYAPFLAMKAIV